MKEATKFSSRKPLTELLIGTLAPRLISGKEEHFDDG